MNRTISTVAVLAVLSFSALAIIPHVYADVIIWQVEANPPGADSGHEWLKILNTGESIHLDGWYVKTTHGRIATQYIPDMALDTCHFYKVNFPSQGIDNKDERIILYDSNGKQIDKTITLRDTKNTDSIWEAVGGIQCDRTQPQFPETNYSTSNNSNYDDDSDKIQELEKEIQRLNGIIDGLERQIKQLVSFINRHL